MLLLFTAVTSIGWGQTTYKLQKVTSIEVGSLYVFEQDGYVMNNTVSSSALQTTNSYNTTGLDGTETYIWSIETASNGYYFKNVSEGKYLNNASGTGVSIGNKSSQWTFEFQADETVLISNFSNSNRFLGYTTSTSHAYKAYATSNLSSYRHAINVYKLVEEGGSTPSTSPLASIALSGTYPTTFNQGDAFSYEGMTVTATYEDNSTKDVTSSATFSGYDMSTTGNQTVTVSYTEEEVTKTTTYNIVVNAPPALASIALSGTYPTTFTQGDAFSTTGMTVTATYEDESTKDVTSSATFSGYDMSTLGAQTVTVSYTEGEVTKTATYQITITEYVQLTEFDANLNNSLFGTTYNGSISGMTDANAVSGTLNRVTITYGGSGNHYINDSQIRFYPNNKLTFEAPEGYNITQIVFTSAGTWAATISADAGTYTSDTKTWAGSATSVLFTGSGTSRCDMSKATITLSPIGTDPVDPEVSFAESSITVQVGKTGTNAITKPNDLTVTYSSGDTGIATVDPETGVVTGVAIGSTTITASWNAVENTYNAGSESYTVNVEAPAAVMPEVSFASDLTLKEGNKKTNPITKPDDLTVTYSSDDTSVATVDPTTGEVTGVAEGETTITASWNAVEYTYLAGSASYTVTVEAAATLVTVDADGNTTFDFTQNDWGFPTGTKAVEEGSFSNSGYTIKVAGTSGNGYSFNTHSSGNYLINGKSGAYLTLPAFDYDVDKIAVVGRDGASGQVVQNIFVGETAVSTATTGATGTNEYEIDENYQAAGNIYSIKVTSGHNTQITSIIVYKKAAAPATVTLDEAVDNSEWLTANNGETRTVTLTRTFSNASYNTLSLPFAVDATTLTNTFGEGTHLMNFTGTSTDADDNIILNFEEVTAIDAGKPYLILPANTVANPTFTDVTISSATTSVSGTDADFMPNINATEYAASEQLMYLGANNTLYFNNTAATMKGFRAYWQLKNASSGKNFRFSYDGATTGIITIDNGQPTKEYENWYTVDGIRLNAAPTQKGVYIYNGKKVVIK